MPRAPPSPHRGMFTHKEKTMTLQETNAGGNRLECLRVLADTLAHSIDTCEKDALLPQLARQYREALREIAELQPETDNGLDDILEGCDRVR